MKKLKKYINSCFTILLLLLVCAALFSSCSDDTTGPSNNYILDTARYNWKVDEIQARIMSAWAYDTNNIYFMDISNQDLIKYNGETYVRNNFSSDFSARCMSGVTNNEIYIGGYDNTEYEPTYGKPQIKCWNGSNFKIINIPDEFLYYSYVSTIYTAIPSIIWIGTNKGRVLKLENNNIEEKYIDTSQYIRSFLRDEMNNLYFLAVRDSCNPNRTYCKEFISIFSYETTNWQRIFYREYEGNQVPLTPNNLGNQIYASDYYHFYKFTGSDFVNSFDVNGFLANQTDWSGTSSSDLMCIGSKSNAKGLCGYIFHWNGKVWSDENIQLQYCLHTIINIQNLYICTASDIYNSCVIYYGKSK